METDFNKELNISYIDENLPKPDMKLVFKHYISSVLVYGIVLFFLINNPFGKEYVVFGAVNILKLCYFAYIFVAPIILVIFRPRSLHISHNITIIKYIVKLFSGMLDIKISSFEEFKNSMKYAIPSYGEKQALMLIFIKAFFGSLMLTYFYNDITQIIQRIPSYQNFIALLQTVININFSEIGNTLIRESDFIWWNITLFLYTIDVFCFSIGYLTETAFLKNKIRTCEISFAGIFFCLLCYSPFNRVSMTFAGWAQNEASVAFGDYAHPVTITLRLIAVFFLVIYTSASIALGTKASNLTNRGTVSKFPYNIVRHPAYISKLSFWLFVIIPAFCVPLSTIMQSPENYFMNLFTTVISFSFWFFIYYMRALTEERHLSQDPEYRKYQEKVKYKFIPGLL